MLFLGFAAAMVGMLLVAFNSGQTTNAKMRAINAADAAAYSGAVYEARMLNFQAYTNRAMVANEVAIAQSVSLRSWVSYVNIFTRNISWVTSWIPYLGVVTSAINRGAVAVNNVVQRVLPPAEILFRAVNAAESSVQSGVNVLGPLAAADIAKNVAQLNGAKISPATNALFVANGVEFLGLTRDYKKTSGRVGSDGRTRMRQVALDSRDGFSHARDWSMGLPFVFEIDKGGGTDLIDFDAWKGLDAAEFNTGWNFLKGEWSTTLPMGWGGAQAYSPRQTSRIGTHGSGVSWSGTAGNLANNDARSNAKELKLGKTIPFQNYRDIVKPSNKEPDLRVPFAVEVVIAKSQIPSANSSSGAKAMKLDGTAIEHDPHYQKDGSYALATACVSFDRPYYGGERNDGAKEYPSLFSPYWRASLATDDRLTRTAVDAAKGLLPVAAVLGGNGSCKAKTS